MSRLLRPLNKSDPAKINGPNALSRIQQSQKFLLHIAAALIQTFQIIHLLQRYRPGLPCCPSALARLSRTLKKRVAPLERSAGRRQITSDGWKMYIRVLVDPLFSCLPYYQQEADQRHIPPNKRQIKPEAGALQRSEHTVKAFAIVRTWAASRSQSQGRGIV